MRHTIEEKMTALKNRKACLYRALMDGPGGCEDRAITKDDFEFLLE
jgi:SNF2 family DNA or RNA helicase